MGNGDITRFYDVLRFDGGACREEPLELIVEEPLLIRVDGRAYSVVMRTPGEEVAHAAGFCLGEGIADEPAHLAGVGHCADVDPNVVDVRLDPDRREAVEDVLARRGFVSQTSCGICGKELAADLVQRVTPMADAFSLPLADLEACLETLARSQKHYRTTRGSHAALLLDGDLAPVSFAEDVGRHNALDKAIGKAFLAGTLPGVPILVLSSRVSYELVQKAARARIPVLMSASRPTALAVDMACSLNMAVAFSADDAAVTVVCGEDRIVRPSG